VINRLRIIIQLPAVHCRVTGLPNNLHCYTGFMGRNPHVETAYKTISSAVAVTADRTAYVVPQIQWRRSRGGPNPHFLTVGVQMYTDPHFIVLGCYTWPVIHSISSAVSG